MVHETEGRYINKKRKKESNLISLQGNRRGVMMVSE